MSRRAADVKRRWDIDEIGHGIASGRAFTPDVQRLEAALELPDWIAEQPEAHLLPHIRQRRIGDSFEYDIATGVLEGDSVFAPHGHLVRLRVRPKAG